MRFIKKAPEPKPLRDWKKAMRGLSDEGNYEAVPTDVKRALRRAMRREQGDLCAYTMKRIDVLEGSHIEHVRPRSHFPGRATDYRNMVLCVPATGPCEYGAIEKGDTRVDEGNFVSPLNENCETRLRFRLSGEVVARRDDDEAAKHTIEILKLNHHILVNARKVAFRAHGLISASKGLSAAQARRLGKTILARDASGRLPPYCVAISQAAATVAQRRETRARRLAAKPAD